MITNTCKRSSVAVLGGWGEWSAWSACKADCGPGFRDRTRDCDSPSPLGEGTSCQQLSGDTNVTHTTCHIRACAPGETKSTCYITCKLDLISLFSFINVYGSSYWLLCFKLIAMCVLSHTESHLCIVTDISVKTVMTVPVEIDDSVCQDCDDSVCEDYDDSICKDCNDNVCKECDDSVCQDCDDSVCEDYDDSICKDCNDNICKECDDSVCHDCDDSVC